VSRPLVVVDTNVLVAGLLAGSPDSPTVRVLDAMLAGRLRFLLSAELLAEYRRVLLRPKIAARHGLSTRQIDELLTALVEVALVREADGSDDDLGLPAGDRHLGLLLAAEPRSRLVTGDRATLRAAGGRALDAASLVAELPA